MIDLILLEDVGILSQITVHHLVWPPQPVDSAGSITGGDEHWTHHTAQDGVQVQSSWNIFGSFMNQLIYFTSLSSSKYSDNSSKDQETHYAAIVMIGVTDTIKNSLSSCSDSERKIIEILFNLCVNH